MPTEFVDLDFKWYPSPTVEANFFARAADSLADLEVPLMESRSAVAADMEHKFDVEGPGWAPWAVQGAAGPRGAYASTYIGGESILKDTGALYGHVSDESSYVVDGNTLSYSPLSEVDGMLDQGTEKMFARPFIGLDDPGEAMVIEVFAIWIDGIIDGAGALPGQTSSAFGIRGKSGRFVG